MNGAVEDSLREQVRAALAATQISQAAVARELGVSTKHLCQMLTGRAPLTLEWAEQIAELCEMRVEVVVLKGARRAPESA
ncbi:helix-turn-helix transcriptional regulator [Streptomyces sp. NBC_00847]|uniref:helix-turn-helix transcriptional regulator n=1 Tax=Streptomyces sp. NBC_00847 TaxID=2975850 RepID=UPI00225E035A|nr:helix-turn-helix transcriptional regulator [Streptomyces sp. NBC_00847]MCX4885949.1 helix-turn-helix domain-containing protein [Streptomyces sp. NBC_00847]